MEAPVWIPLCDSRALQALFDETKNNMKESDKEITRRLYGAFGSKLYNLIWQPLEKELTGVKRIFYSPSGALHKISFDAILVDASRRLFDQYEMKLVSSTREIKRLKTEKAEFPQGSAVLYGGIDYGKIRGGVWNYLPGSKIEMEQISTILKKHNIDYKTFIGTDAIEESFKNLSGQHTTQIVISTHGFFLDDIKQNNNEEIVRRLGGGSQKSLENPLLRSGLVLAGGNAGWVGQPKIEGIEDGILTAYEISKLNLLNTNLVVLSACQTGLGEVKNSEGVFGLQRAFKLAGVESLIMSLWQVNDKVTQIITSTFYEKWLDGKTKQEAFRIAQNTVRKEFPSPYYWAAFVIMD
jgi:CHAT domain-containing protein